MKGTYTRSAGKLLDPHSLMQVCVYDFDHQLQLSVSEPTRASWQSKPQSRVFTRQAGAES